MKKLSQNKILIPIVTLLSILLGIYIAVTKINSSTQNSELSIKKWQLDS